MKVEISPVRNVMHFVDKMHRSALLVTTASKSSATTAKTKVKIISWLIVVFAISNIALSVLQWRYAKIVTRTIAKNARLSKNVECVVTNVAANALRNAGDLVGVIATSNFVNAVLMRKETAIYAASLFAASVVVATAVTTAAGEGHIVGSAATTIELPNATSVHKTTVYTNAFAYSY